RLRKCGRGFRFIRSQHCARRCRAQQQQHFVESSTVTRRQSKSRQDGGFSRMHVWEGVRWVELPVAYVSHLTSFSSRMDTMTPTMNPFDRKGWMSGGKPLNMAGSIVIMQ